MRLVASHFLLPNLHCFSWIYEHGPRSRRCIYIPESTKYNRKLHLDEPMEWVCVDRLTMWHSGVYFVESTIYSTQLVVSAFACLQLVGVTFLKNLGPCISLIRKKDREDKITESKTAYFRYSYKESGLSEETTQVSIGIEDSHYRVMEPHVAEVPSGGWQRAWIYG